MRELLDKYLINSFYYERADWEWDFWEFKGFVTIYKYCGGETNIAIPKELNGEPVVAIRPRAFVDCGIKRIVIPPTVKLIAEGAFLDCAADCKITTLSHFALYKKSTNL